MLALLLTEQAKAAETGEAVDFQRHQHVELLLGVYSRQLNNQLMEIQFLLQRIQCMWRDIILWAWICGHEIWI